MGVLTLSELLEVVSCNGPMVHLSLCRVLLNCMLAVSIKCAVGWCNSLSVSCMSVVLLIFS